MKITRRQFLETTGATLATTAVTGCGGEEPSPGPPTEPPPDPTGDTGTPGTTRPTGDTGLVQAKAPNILVIIIDQERWPRYAYGAEAGSPDALRDVLSFATGGTFVNAQGQDLFPGRTSLRKHAVVFRSHYIAATACIPSRATMFTGHYAPLHGVEQTDGLYKSPTDEGMGWLDPQGVPTLGDWFRAGGYDTAYRGKWHLSHFTEEEDPESYPEGLAVSLDDYGFGPWDGPEPHGADVQNLGIHRDPAFAEQVATWLQERADLRDSGDAAGEKPWLLVASFVNPHDIVGYPQPWYSGVQGLETPPGRPKPVPAQGEISTELDVPLSSDYLGPRELNRLGFPDGLFLRPDTFREDLSSKPSCHAEYAEKVYDALKAPWPEPIKRFAPYPFNEEWIEAYGGFYRYLSSLVDEQIDRVITALEATGFREDTLVVFMSDHGQVGGAHGGMVEKWHQAYEETIHVPFLVSGPLVNPQEEPRFVDALSSHVDLLPTLLGLAGLDPDQLLPELGDHTLARAPVGADLSPHVRGERGGTEPVIDSDGAVREAIYFMTDDEITEGEQRPPEVPPVAQPNHLRCVRTTEWKFARYFDPSGVEADEFELYYLPGDPLERANLVGWAAGSCVVRADLTEADVATLGLTLAEVEAARVSMLDLLARQEALRLVLA